MFAKKEAHEPFSAIEVTGKVRQINAACVNYSNQFEAYYPHKNLNESFNANNLALRTKPGLSSESNCPLKQKKKKKIKRN